MAKIRTPGSLALAAWLIAGPLDAQGPDSIYANAATAALVAEARLRHHRQDSLVRDYRATVRTRVDASAGQSRFARLFPLIAHETVARVTWRRPDDLRMEVLGVRGRSAFDDIEPDILFEQPWFVPRALGDSIRLWGLPETAALHPLADGAAHYYRYALRDSLVMELPGRTIRAFAIRVEPRRLGPALVAGDMWVDAVTGDVVRLTVTFLGEFLWSAPEGDDAPADSARARRDTRTAQRFLSVDADLEYALYDNAFWMPYRQLLSLMIEWDILFRGALPVRAVTRFEDYRINADLPIAFVLPPDDSAGARTRCPACPPGENTSANRRARGFVRGGSGGEGRWEISYPPRDSMWGYQWKDSLTLELSDADRERIRRTVADLARVAEDLPDEWVGRPRHSLQWERIADVVRYNRVQGPSLGLGYELRPGPAFTTLDAGARFGVSDRRVTGGLTWRRDAPGGRLEVAAYRAVHEAEPWTNGQSLGNSISALLSGRDEADYHLALGGGITFAGYTGFAQDLEVTLRAARHRSMAVEAGWLGGSAADIRPNPAVAEGDFVRARAVRAIHFSGHVASVELGVEGLVGDDVLGGRGWLRARVPFRAFARTGALTLRGGLAGGDVVPQLRYRVGGVETVRGYPYGFRSGERFWSAQLDVALTRGWLIAPVVSADAGGTFDTADPLLSVGGGVSFFGGLIRFNLAKGVRPARDVRFDVLFRAPR